MKASIYIFLIMSLPLVGQNILTVQEVKGQLLNSLQSQMDQLSVDMADNTAHPGMAGLLPIVQAQGNYQYQLNDSKTEFDSPGIPDIDAKSAVVTNLSASLGAQYTVYSGGRGKNTLAKLRKSTDLTRISRLMSLERRLFNALQIYRQIQSLDQMIPTAQEAVVLSKDRLDWSRLRKDYGQASATELLDASVAFRSDSINLANLKIQTKHLKRQLNTLLDRDVETEFELEKLSSDHASDLDTWLQSAKSNNHNLSIQMRRSELAQLDLDITKSAFLPNLSLNASYGYSEQNNEASFLKKNSALGLTAGATLTIPIYSGNTRKIQKQNAQIQLKQSMLTTDLLWHDLERDIRIAYENHRWSNEQIQIQEANINDTRTRLDWFNRMLREGQVNSLEYRTAQLAYLHSINRKDQLELERDLALLSLQWLSGTLWDSH